MLGAAVIVSLLGHQLSKLHVGATFTLSVLKFIGQLKVSLHKHLQLLLVHLSVLILATDFTQIANGHTLACNAAHLDGVAQSELMVDGSLFMVIHVVVNYTQVYVSQELASHICDFLVLSVEFNCVFVELRLCLSQFHIANSYAVIGECFSMDVSYGFANLEESFILVNGLFELAQVVKEHACAVVSSALVSGLACSLASESQDVVVLKTLLSSNAVVGVSVGHVES